MMTEHRSSYFFNQGDTRQFFFSFSTSERFRSSIRNDRSCNRMIRIDSMNLTCSIRLNPICFSFRLDQNDDRCLNEKWWRIFKSISPIKKILINKFVRLKVRSATIGTFRWLKIFDFHFISLCFYFSLSQFKRCRLVHFQFRTTLIDIYRFRFTISFRIIREIFLVKQRSVHSDANDIDVWWSNVYFVSLMTTVSLEGKKSGMKTFSSSSGNGEFSKDEFYSFALRLNIYPRFHRFLKQQTTTSSWKRARQSAQKYLSVSFVLSFYLSSQINFVFPEQPIIVMKTSVSHVRRLISFRWTTNTNRTVRWIISFV